MIFKVLGFYLVKKHGWEVVDGQWYKNHGPSTTSV